MEEIEIIKSLLLESRQQSLIIMRSLDSQFQVLKDRILKDRVDEIDGKIIDLQKESLPDWVDGLQDLNNELLSSLEMAENHHKFRHKNCEKELDFEKQTAYDEFANKKEAYVQKSLHSFYGLLYNKNKQRENNKRSISVPSFIEYKYPKKRLKPTTVTGPFIVYQLNEGEISEDLSAITKGIQDSYKYAEEYFIQQNMMTTPG